MKKILLLVTICFAFININAQIKIDMMAPEISLPNTKDSIVKLSSFKGKVVLIDFWASWCGPCRQSIPALIKLYKKYASAGFVIYGISIDAKKREWKKAIKLEKINYLQVNDNKEWEGDIAKLYNVDKIPSTFLLDKTGKIIAIDLEDNLLENKIKMLLKNK